jgi:hypothetical protein
LIPDKTDEAHSFAVLALPRGSGFIFASFSISLSAAERFSSAPISRAFSMKALDWAGSSGV